MITTETNGTILLLDVQDTISDMLVLICNKCGHPLKDHAFVHADGTLKKFYTSQCLKCGTKNNNFICPQFSYQEKP